MDILRVWIRDMLDWLAVEPKPPLIHTGLYRWRSRNRPVPYVSLLFQDGRACGWWELGGERFEFPPDHLVLLATHRGSRSAPITGPDGIWYCTFDVGRQPRFASLLRDYRFCPVPVRDKAPIRQAYRKVAECYGVAGAAASHRLKAALLELFATALEHMAGPERSTGPLYSAAVGEALRFIQHSWSDSTLSLPDVARAAGLSAHHFGRVFRREVGASPMQYLRDLRLERARRLLRHSDLRIGEVARECGVSDPLYFSRIFRHHTGQSPRRYRAQGSG
ncbi:MAG: helix-turn-helix transcriptional regulator [Kiritimatiellae bacterium]|nr:helix-turn-helix transcriptional regulator [Kiritimatiellia bacterium]